MEGLEVAAEGDVMAVGEKRAPDSKSKVRNTSEPGEGMENYIPLSLPESAYSAIMILPLCSHLGRTPCKRIWIFAQVFGCHFCNVVFQGMFLGYVFDMYAEQEEAIGTCGGRVTNDTLRGLCILVYMAYCIADLAETFKMGVYINAFPKAAKWEKLLLVENEEGEFEYASGMPRWYKFYCYSVVLFPKFCIAGALAGYGTGFVVNTEENADLVLNALALTFILEIDELMYDYFMTFQMQEIVSEQIPSIHLKADTMQSMNKHYGMFVKAGVLIAATMTTYYSYCPQSAGED